MTKVTVVYWLYDHNCNQPELDGYIGISNNPRRRYTEHKKYNRRFPEQYEMKIIFEGTRKDCLSRERNLRPIPGMGWNLQSGGGDPPKSKLGVKRPNYKGVPCTEEAKRKISLAKKGMKHSEQIKSQISRTMRSNSPKKLTTEKVQEIRSDTTRTYKELSLKYQISEVTVHKVKKYLSWT